VLRGIPEYDSLLQDMTQIDAYFYLEKIDKVSAQLLPQIASLQNIIKRVSQSAHDYLVNAETEIL
jgi:hypothetical protein